MNENTTPNSDELAKSYDPRDPTNPPNLITGWLWKVIEAPQGTDPGMYSFQGETTPLFNFWAPLAGHYVVGLTVSNADANSQYDIYGEHVNRFISSLGVVSPHLAGQLLVRTG